MTTVVSVLLLFGSLIVHELGHALVARRQGIEVEKIDLFLFGGLTQMSRDAASPGEDFKVAIAGPLATFGVILLCLAIDLPIVGASRLGHAVVLDSTIRITPGAPVTELAAVDERPAAGVQHPPGVPARRRPHRPLHRLAGDRRQAPRHAWRPAAWARASPWSWPASGSGGRLVGGELRRPVADGAGLPDVAVVPGRARCSRRWPSGSRGSGSPTSWTPIPWRSRRRRRSPRRWTSSSCATSRRGCRSSTTPAICSGIARQERAQASIDGGEAWLTIERGARVRRRPELARAGGPADHRAAGLRDAGQARRADGGGRRGRPARRRHGRPGPPGARGRRSGARWPERAGRSGARRRRAAPSFILRLNALP